MGVYLPWVPSVERRAGPTGARRVWRRLNGLSDRRGISIGFLPRGRPLTLASRLAAGRSPQPVCSASSTMIPLRAANAAAPIAVFVGLHLANGLRAAGLQASDDGVDLVGCEFGMADARGVFAGGCPPPPRPDGCETWSARAVRGRWGLHHRDLRPDALEPHHTVHPTALDRPLARSLSPSSTKNAVAAVRSSTTMPTCSKRWIVMRSMVATRRPRYSVPRLPIGWQERAAHWSEETSDELPGSVGSQLGMRACGGSSASRPFLHSSVARAGGLTDQVVALGDVRARRAAFRLPCGHGQA